MGGRQLTFGPLVGALSASVGTATNTIVGTSPADGNLVWGKWGAGSNLTDFNYTTGANPLSVPWITGDAINNIPPTLGSQIYTMIAGAALVINNNTGTAGTMNSASIVADFVNRSVNVSLNATNTNLGRTYQMDASGGFAPTTGRFSQGFNSVTCSGGGCGAGFFAGAQAQGAGVAFTAGGNNGVSGVVGLRR